MTLQILTVASVSFIAVPNPDADRQGIPELIEALIRESEGFSDKAQKALVQRGKVAVPALVELLRWQPPLLPEKNTESRDEERKDYIRFLAGHVLSRIGQPAIAPLVHILEGPDAVMARAAADGLGALRDRHAEEIRPALERALHHKSNAVRACVAFACYRLGIHSDAIVPALRVALDDPHADTRARVASSLSFYRHRAASCTPRLVELLADESAAVRHSAAGALGAIGAAKSMSLQALIELLADGEPIVRATAAVSLAKVQPAATEAIPALLKALADKDRSVRSSALDSLIQLGGPLQACLARLRAGLRDDSWYHQSTLNRIASLGKAARPLVPALLKFLRGNSGNDADLAIRALVDLAPEDRDVQIALVRYAANESNSAYSVVRKQLVQLGPKLKPVLPELIRLLKHGSNKRNVPTIIGAMGPAGAEAIPALEEAMVRAAMEPTRASVPPPPVAARALGKMGRKAIPTIRRRLGDADPRVRRDAWVAVEHLGAEAAPLVPYLIPLLDRAPVRALKLIARIGSDNERREATEQLHRLGVKDGVKDKESEEAKLDPAALAALLDDESQRINALQRLEKLGVAAREVAPRVAALQADVYASPPVPWLGQQIRTLAAIEPEPNLQLPLLRRVIAAYSGRRGNQAAWVAACDVLAKLGPRAAEVVSAFENYHFSWLDSRAIKALGSVGPVAAPAAAAIAERLRSFDASQATPGGRDIRDIRDIRIVCCEALAAIGPGANTAAVRNALSFPVRSHNPEVRAAALRALERIAQSN